MKALTVQGSYVGSLVEIAELIELVKRRIYARRARGDAPAGGGERSTTSARSRSSGGW
jgi:hypothetical protein